MAFEGTIQLDRCADCQNRKGSCLGKLYNEGPGGSFSVVGLAAGHHLFRAGDTIDSVYLLRSGALKTYVTSPDGEEQILAFHSAGDIIGLDSLSAGRHGRNTVALNRAEVCRMPMEAFMQACSRSPVLQSRLVEGMGQEIQRLQGMLRLERMTAEQRIVYFLLNQARRQSRGAGIEARRIVQLAMSRGEIGRFLDLATETVSRCLTRLQAGGCIRICRNEIELLDLAALQRLAQGGESDKLRLAA